MASCRRTSSFLLLAFTLGALLRPPSADACVEPADATSATSAAGLSLASDARPSELEERRDIRASGADQLLFAFFAISLFGVILLYRREESAEQRLRLIASAGLIAVLFLCTAPAMPWSEGVAFDGSAQLCMLGDEARCVAEQAAFAGVSSSELEATLERADWATAGVRAGHMTLLVLLLPAFIWLMVAPRNRGAQALVVGGAIPATVTAAATLAFTAILGSWTVRAGGAPDLTLVATASLVVISILVAITGRRLRRAQDIPVARVARH